MGQHISNNYTGTSNIISTLVTTIHKQETLIIELVSNSA